MRRVLNAMMILIRAILNSAGRDQALGWTRCDRKVCRARVCDDVNVDVSYPECRVIASHLSRLDPATTDPILALRPRLLPTVCVGSGPFFGDGMLIYTFWK